VDAIGEKVAERRMRKKCLKSQVNGGCPIMAILAGPTYPHMPAFR
jgi:hypothetical protein